MKLPLTVLPRTRRPAPPCVAGGDPLAGQVPGTGGPEADLAQLPPVPAPAGEPIPAEPGRAAVWAACAVLLRYPDPLPDVETLRAVADVAPTAGGLAPVLEHLAASEPLAAQAHFVATFDTRRRCCPYLTYYLHGDTRRRGVALWRVKTALAGCGVEPAGGELPDHLAVLCEFAATVDESVAVALLVEHRAGLALLAAALADAGSPYAAVPAVIDALLPADGAGEAAAQAVGIAAGGPPAETVGLPGRLAPFLPDRGSPEAPGSFDDRGVRR